MAENGKGNVLFLDGSPDGMQSQLRDLMAMQQLHLVGTNHPATPPEVPQ